LPCHPLFVFCLLSLSLFPMECFFILAKIKKFFLKKTLRGPIQFCKEPHFKSGQKKNRCTFFIFVLERHTSSTCSSIGTYYIFPL
jgi:hypothetical protein